jgi:hypothetical protein
MRGAVDRLTSFNAALVARNGSRSAFLRAKEAGGESLARWDRTSQSLPSSRSTEHTPCMNKCHTNFKLFFKMNFYFLPCLPQQLAFYTSFPSPLMQVKGVPLITILEQFNATHNTIAFRGTIGGGNEKRFGGYAFFLIFILFCVVKALRVLPTTRLVAVERASRTRGPP